MKKATAKKQKIKTTLNNTAHGKYRHHRAGMRGGCKASREGRKDRHLDGGQKPRVREQSGEESPEEDLGHRDNVCRDTVARKGGSSWGAGHGRCPVWGSEVGGCEPCFPVWLPVGGVLALAPLLEMWGGC